MSQRPNYEPAREPEDLARHLLSRINAGDVEGLVALYESDAVLVLPDGYLAVGAAAIVFSNPGMSLKRA